MMIMFIVAIQVNKPIAFSETEYIVLSDSSPDVVIPSSTQAVVYGTATPNQVTLESGANVNLINFQGNNTITVESDPSSFLVCRSGATVNFKSSDGTDLKIPATLSLQEINFDDLRLYLTVDQNEVKLMDIQTDNWELYDSFDNQELDPNLWETSFMKPNSDEHSIEVDNGRVKFELKESASSNNKIYMIMNFSNSAEIKAIKVKVYIESATDDIRWRIGKGIGIDLNDPDNWIYLQTGIKPFENFIYHSINKCIGIDCEEEEDVTLVHFYDYNLIGKTLEMIVNLSRTTTEVQIDEQIYSAPLINIGADLNDKFQDHVSLSIKSTSGAGTGVFYLEEVLILR